MAQSLKREKKPAEGQALPLKDRLREDLHNGKVKNLTIKYDAGEWYAIFICEVPDQPKKPIQQIADDRISGGDMGLLQFLTLSDGSNRGYPKYLRKVEDKIKRLQRVLSRSKDSSKNFRKLALRIARLHRHVACQRKNHQNNLMATLLQRKRRACPREAGWKT